MAKQEQAIQILKWRAERKKYLNWQNVVITPELMDLYRRWEVDVESMIESAAQELELPELKPYALDEETIKNVYGFIAEEVITVAEVFPNVRDKQDEVEKYLTDWLTGPFKRLNNRLDDILVDLDEEGINIGDQYKTNQNVEDLERKYRQSRIDKLSYISYLLNKEKNEE